MQAGDPARATHGKIISRGGLAQAETAVEERGIIRLRMIRSLGDEDDGIDGRGIQAHLRKQPLRRIRAEIKGGDTGGGDPALAESDGLGDALERGALQAGGQSVRDIIAHDRSGRHGDAGDADIGEGGMHELSRV